MIVADQQLLLRGEEKRERVVWRLALRFVAASAGVDRGGGAAGCEVGGRDEAAQR